MPSMYLALGNRCNHKCFFCPCGKNSEKALCGDTKQLIEAIAEGVRENRIDHITLSGGEPTLHPNFHEILSFCIENSLSISLLSNGETFHDRVYLERCLGGLDLSSFQVTTAIHSMMPELHEKVTGVSGSFDRTVKGLHNIINMNIPVTIKQVISKWNYEQLPDFVNMVFETFGPKTSVTLCGMDFCGMTQDKIDEVAIGYTKIGPYLEKALDNVISLREKFQAFPLASVSDLPLCCIDPYYWGFFAVVSRNCISQYSAPKNLVGDIKNNNDIINDCDVYFEDCKNCCVVSHCPGVWRTAYNYFGNEEAHAVHAVIDGQ